MLSQHFENTTAAFRGLDLGLNVKNRIIYVDDAIEIYTIAYIQQRIYTIAELSGDDKTPITIQLSCYGGDVYGMLGIVDLFEAVPMKINTYAVGTAMSAAVTVLASGTGVRSMTKRTTIMEHEMSSWAHGKSSDIEAEANHNKALQKQIWELMGEKTNKSSRYWKDHSKNNFYLTAQKCLEYGIVDKVV